MLSNLSYKTTCWTIFLIPNIFYFFFPVIHWNRGVAYDPSISEGYFTLWAIHGIFKEWNFIYSPILPVCSSPAGAVTGIYLSMEGGSKWMRSCRSVGYKIDKNNLIFVCCEDWRGLKGPSGLPKVSWSCPPWMVPAPIWVTVMEWWSAPGEEAGDRKLIKKKIKFALHVPDGKGKMAPRSPWLE